jgi:GTPase SAR1 family protein
MKYQSSLTETTYKTLSELLSLFSQFDCPETYIVALKSSIEELSKPCRLAITGRVKAGKSTLINVLLNGDYAKVGISETTATINIFEYGNPENTETPILCKYVSGEKEWISRQELDALQGNSDEIINKISEIESLTYYLNDECLKNVTLIDTPGIDAVVGECGNAHQEQTELYLGLRNRHKEQTINLSNNADAVVLLLGDVTHESDVDFIDSFLSSRGINSSINTIGVLSQIDLSDERIENRFENARERYDKLSKYVNCVIPISAGLKFYLPSINESQEIKRVLSKIPSKELLCSIALRGPQYYFRDNLPGINISLNERKKIYPKEMPFRCFAVIAKLLYENEINDAINKINDLSGIDYLKEILDSLFFKRSQQIKVENSIQRALLVIWDFLNCNHGPFIIKSTLSLDEIANQIHNCQIQLEKLFQECGNINKYFQCLLLLLENESLFTKEEYVELKELFSNTKKSFDVNRLNYWFGQSNIIMNEKKRYIAKLAYNKYTDLACL